MKEIFVNESSNLINYDLSYKFLNQNIGIDVKETYPLRNSFHISDVNNKNYILVKISNEDLEKYKIIFEILKRIRENGAYVSSVYSKDGQEIFKDDVKNEYYIIFKLPEGNYRKWAELDFNLIKESLIKFYNSSNGILNDLYNFNLKEDMKLLTMGNEIKIIDIYLDIIENINKTIFYKSDKGLLDKIFIENKEYMKEELLKGREFFSSDEFKSYCEDLRNIRFINRNLSNRSFLFNNEKCFITNFFDSSINLFTKDISIFIEKSLQHVESDKILKFIKEILKEFPKEKIHQKVILNYMKIYNYVFRLFNEQYVQVEPHKNFTIEEKIYNLNNYKQKYDFITKRISSM